MPPYIINVFVDLVREYEQVVVGENHLGQLPEFLFRIDAPRRIARRAEDDQLRLRRDGRFELRGATLTSAGDDEDSTLTVTLVDGGEEKHLTASGNGPLDAFVTALESTGLSVRILDYVEHALSEGRDAKAASYVECEVDGQVLWGVGIDPSITTSSFKAVISALNRALR